MTADFEILLIEDNPGDARLIEEMLRDTRELLARIDPDAPSGSDTGAGTSFDDVRLHHETRLSEGIDRLAETDPAVVLLDLDLPDSTGVETLETAVTETDRMPIVVLTGLDDTEVGINAIQRGAHEYLVKDDLTEGLLVRSIHHAIERVRSATERERRREQLESLNRLNGVVQDVTHAAIRARTREELERMVCDRLVDDDGYQHAWIGDGTRGSDRLEPRVSAGDRASGLDMDSITTHIDTQRTDPTAHAPKPDEVQVVAGPASDSDTGLSREASGGIHSSVLIPISYDELRYGVVCLTITDPDPITDPEIGIFERLGDVIGHAIAAIERREALMSDTILELEFTSRGFLTDLASLTEDSDARIDIRSFVDGDEAVLAYGTIEGVDRSQVQEIADGDGDIADVRVLAGGDQPVEVEFAVSGIQELFTTVASYGGRIGSATIVDGELRFVSEVPPGRDTRQLIELITDQFPSVGFVAQRTRTRSDEDVTELQSILQSLTDRQKTTVETAYLAGYFDWPRESSGEEVAQRLGISAATFSEHLRAAERKLFGGIFEDA